MSRIGKAPINIADGVTVEVNKNTVTVKGAKGSLDMDFRPEVGVSVSEGSVVVEKKGNGKLASSLWGTTASLIRNMIKGVSEGYEKQLELNGVGFRMALQGKKLNMALGFSHPVELETPEGVEVKIEGNILTVSGINKHQVGQFAAKIKSLKPVEPYKGKGFKYVGEHVIRKEGKRAAA